MLTLEAGAVWLDILYNTLNYISKPGKKAVRYIAQQGQSRLKVLGLKQSMLPLPWGLIFIRFTSRLGAILPRSNSPACRNAMGALLLEKAPQVPYFLPFSAIACHSVAALVGGTVRFEPLGGVVPRLSGTTKSGVIRPGPRLPCPDARQGDGCRGDRAFCLVGVGRSLDLALFRCWCGPW